jgi:hypothetical protein
VITRLREERGISAIIVSVSLVGLFGAAMLAIDAGSAWATRRKIVTGTDAAALAAARYFSNNPGQACLNGDGTWNGLQVPGGNAEATTVLSANSSDAEHDAANGFLLTVSGCSTGHPVGHVRFDGRLGSQQAFSGVFGFSKVKPLSSSTAEFGYITSPVGLRPIAICDQSTVTWTGQPVIPLGAVPGPSSLAPTGYYPHFALWNWFQKGTPATFDQAAYDRYFGTLDSDYPSISVQTGNPAKGSINNGLPYLSPANGGGVVHRINSRDSCNGGAEWRGWVDLNGGANGGGSVDSQCPPPRDKLQTLECMLKIGYNNNPAPVGVGDPSTSPVTPPQCNNSPSPWCLEDSGGHNGVKDSLDYITCPAAETSADCVRDGKTIVVILDNGVFLVSGNDEVHQVAFVNVIMRGWGDPASNNPCNGNSGCFFDFEFVSIQTTGTIGHNPSPTDVSPKGTDLCGIDHDTFANRCTV